MTREEDITFELFHAFFQLMYDYGYLTVSRSYGIEIFRKDGPGSYRFDPDGTDLRAIVSSPSRFVTELCNYFTRLDLKSLP